MSDSACWIAPVTRRNSLVWLDACQGDLVTPSVLEWHKAKGMPATCAQRAKIDFRGRKLCVRHARMAALHELVGDMPQFRLLAVRTDEPR
jgi:hypothetical protein